MKLNKSTLFSILVSLSYICSHGQTGGSHAYEFLLLTNSSRQAALGGNALSVNDEDVSLVLSNPSLITEEVSGQLMLNYSDYFSDINIANVTYARTFEKVGSFAASMQYLNYGTFLEADETGQTYGEFSAADYALTIGWGRKIHPNVLIGANLKGVYSSLYLFNSAAIGVDLAATWQLPDHFFSTSILVRNAGRQIKPYYPGSIEPMPFEIQFAASKKLLHVPLRFHLLLHNLQTWDLTYNDPNIAPEIDPFTGEVIEPSKLSDISNKLMHHVIFGMELAPGKSISFRVGYNYHRRQEMKVASRLSTVGLSWGFGIKIYKFKLSYARSAYHLAGSPNVITLTTNLSDFLSD